MTALDDVRGHYQISVDYEPVFSAYKSDEE